MTITQNATFPRRAFVAGAATFGVLALVQPRTAFGDIIAEKKAQADAAYAALNAMQDTLDQISDVYYEALAEQEAAQQAMDEAQAQIEEATGRISSLQSHLGNSLRSTYKAGPTSFLDVLMGASSFEEFSTSLDMLNDISEDKAETVVQIKEQRAALEAAKAEYAAQEAMAAQKAAEAKEAKEEAEAMVAQYQAAYNALTAEVAMLVEERRRAQEAAAAAQARAVVEASAAQGRAAAGGGDGGYSRSDDAGGDSYAGSGYSSSYSGDSDAVARAYSAIGTQYQWGASSSNAFDCSGLVSYAVTGSYGHAYTSSSLMGYSAVSDPQPGDVCVRDGHCGIYIGNGQMIHSPHTGSSVQVASVQSGMKIVRPN